VRALACWLVVAGCGRIAFEPIDAAAPCPPTALLCDDFETGDISRWTSRSVGTGASIAVDALAPHRGQFALDATVPASPVSGIPASACLETSQISSGMLAMRAWIYPPTALDNYDAVLLFKNAPSCATTSSQYAIAGGAMGAWNVSEDSSAGLHDHHATVPGPAVDTWTCLELDYAFAPPHIQLYANDAIVLDVTADDPAPAFNAMLAGVTNSTTSGYHVFVDDVVVDRAHVGCN
jgi:hypothetical protein